MIACYFGIPCKERQGTKLNLQLQLQLQLLHQLADLLQTLVPGTSALYRQIIVVVTGVGGEVCVR